MHRNRSAWLVAGVVLVGLLAWTQRPDNGALLPPGSAPSVHAPATAPGELPGDVTGSASAAGPGYPAFLPSQAHPVLDDIARGGPYDYRQDGGVFQNRERELPTQPRGYYREFTVPTPGSRDRGARRIVTGGDPPVEYFYTDDHYRSFRRFQLPAASR
ncbi:ribonuclease domain-containing protein [Lysobacter sp. A421]